MGDEAIPLPFRIRRGETLIGNGVLWPDGVVTTYRADVSGVTQSFSSLAVLEANLAAGEVVAWYRRDTYTDAAAPVQEM